MPSSSDYVMLCLRFYNQDTPDFSSKFLWGSNILDGNILIDTQHENRDTFLQRLPPYSSKIGTHHWYRKL